MSSKPNIQKKSQCQSTLTSGIVQLLACIMMFSLPWASDIPIPGANILSVGFNFGSIGLILIWFFTVKKPFSHMPQSFLFLAIFVFLHCLIVYGFIHTNELFSENLVNLGDRIEQRSTLSVFLVKIMLFFFTVYAIASLCCSMSLLKKMTFSLGISILLIALLTGGISNSSTDIRFSGGYSNPNAFASVTMLLGYLSAVVFSEKKFHSGSRFFAGLLVAVSVIMILMTASRSAFVSVIGGVCIFLFTQNFQRGLQYLTLLIVFGLVISSIGSASQLGYVFSRFSSGDTTARIYIWADYIRNWKEYIEYGVGLGRELTVLKTLTVHGRIWVPHNTYLRMLVAFGIPGFLLFCFSLWSLLIALIRTQRTRLGNQGSKLLIAFLFSTFIQIFFGDHFSNRTFWVSLGLIGAFISQFNEQAACQNEIISGVSNQSQ